MQTLAMSPTKTKCIKVISNVELSYCSVLPAKNKYIRRSYFSTRVDSVSNYAPEAGCRLERTAAVGVVVCAIEHQTQVLPLRGN
jgi:hypothetical protein